jgi:hypothetical protein
MELVQLDREKLDSLDCAIELEYVEETGAFAAQYFPVQVVYINRDTWHLMNPHTYEAMKTARPDAKQFDCLLVTIPAQDEIGAAIALNGGINGLLAARPANDNANRELINYIMRTYQLDRKKLFGLGADAPYWLDFIDWQTGKNEPAPEQVTPQYETVTVTHGNFSIPELDLAGQATKTDVQGLQWLAWGSQARSRKAQAIHFYVDDSRFAAVASNPDSVAATGATIATECNYSAYELTEPAIAIGNIYRKRKINQSLQQGGLKTIVDLNIPRNQFFMALYGVPKGWAAYSNKWYQPDESHLIEAYQLAQQHAGTDDILYIVFGTEGAQNICQEYGWNFVNVGYGGRNGA